MLSRLPALFSRVRRKLADERGVTLIEVMIGSVLTLMMALAAATVQNYQSRGNRLSSAQSSNVTLAAAIRTQLSRRESCVPSFLVRPASYTAPSEVAVTLGPDLADQPVRAGQEMSRWKLRVSSLAVKNLAPYGTTNSGNRVYLGDIVLRSDTQELSPGTRVAFKEVLVARLTFEVSGVNNLVACYAGDSYSDTTQQLEQVCQMVTSPDGVPGAWIGGRCVVNDANPATTCAAQGGAWDGSSCLQSPAKNCIAQGNVWDGANCIPPPAKTCATQGGIWDGSTCSAPPARVCASLGGAWNGSRCNFPSETFVVARGVDFGYPGGTWYPATCPPGSAVTGGTCHSGSGPPPPLGGILLGNSFYCAWPPGYESTQYNIYAVCIR